MARVQRRREPAEPEESKVPPPIEGGTDHIEALGWFIDDVIMGHRRTDARIERQMSRYTLAETPDDPPPSTAPPPVPDGDEPVTRGGEPEAETRERGDGEASTRG